MSVAKYPSKLTTAMILQHGASGFLHELNEDFKIIRQFALDDYKDEYIIPKITDGNYPVKFKLSYEPIGELRIYINGIKYPFDCYHYDKDDNSVEWLFTSEKGGFDLSNHELIIEYDYDRSIVRKLITENVLGSKESTEGLCIEIPWYKVEEGLIVDYGFHKHIIEDIILENDNGNLVYKDIEKEKEVNCDCEYCSFK